MIEYGKTVEMTRHRGVITIERAFGLKATAVLRPILQSMELTNRVL